MNQATDTALDRRDDGAPLVLDVDSILAIHRHDDGQIAVAKKRPPDAKHAEALSGWTATRWL